MGVTFLAFFSDESYRLFAHLDDVFDYAYLYGIEIAKVHDVSASPLVLDRIMEEKRAYHKQCAETVEKMLG